MRNGITQFVPGLPKTNVEQLLSLVEEKEFNKKKQVVPTSKENENRLIQLLKFITGNGIWNTNDIFMNKDGLFVDLDTEESGLDAWRGPVGWNRFDHCLQRFLKEGALTEEGTKEMKRKIRLEGDSGIDGLHEIFKKK